MLGHVALDGVTYSFDPVQSQTLFLSSSEEEEHRRTNTRLNSKQLNSLRTVPKSCQSLGHLQHLQTAGPLLAESFRPQRISLQSGTPNS